MQDRHPAIGHSIAGGPGPAQPVLSNRYVSYGALAGDVIFLMTETTAKAVASFRRQISFLVHLSYIVEEAGMRITTNGSCAGEFARRQPGIRSR